VFPLIIIYINTIHMHHLLLGRGGVCYLFIHNLIKSRCGVFLWVRSEAVGQRVKAESRAAKTTDQRESRLERVGKDLRRTGCELLKRDKQL
jgi:hypothetical protein